MRLTKLIQRRIRKRSRGIDFASDVNAAVAANVGERRSTTHVSSTQTTKATQGGRHG
jgi:hypothetical protein